jgi:uncharacterized protein (DUF2249 family)
LASAVGVLAVALLLSSCSLFSRLFESDRDLARDRIDAIVDALDDHDASALKAMFTDYARTEYSAELDAGIDRLLLLFPEGEVDWGEESSLAGGSSKVSSYGSRAKMVYSWQTVESGGETFRINISEFTVNDFDPENVGLWELSIVPHVDSSNQTWVVYNGCGPVDIREPRDGGPPGVYVASGPELSRDRMARIIEAINDHDSARLENMFTTYARDGFAREIESGIDDLFTLFPRGDLTWVESDGASALCERFDDSMKTVLLPTAYTVSSDGEDYRLYFADFTENTIDPDNVGLYALGAVPAREYRMDVPEAYLSQWACSFDTTATFDPGAYVPTVAGEYDDIACSG